MAIKGIDLGDLSEGQEWDDFLSVTLTRRDWHIALAAITQMGQQVCEGIEDMAARAKQGDVIAMLMGAALVESNTDLQNLSLGIVQVVNPAMYAAVKEAARANADA